MKNLEVIFDPLAWHQMHYIPTPPIHYSMFLLTDNNLKRYLELQQKSNDMPYDWYAFGIEWEVLLVCLVDTSVRSLRGGKVSSIFILHQMPKRLY